MDGCQLKQTVPGCPCLERSPTGGCVDRHVAMVMVVLRSGCSTSPLVSAAHECLLSLDFCQSGWGGFFVRLVGWFGIFCCWVTQRVNLIGGQLVLFYTVFQCMGPLLFHRSVFLTVFTMRSANPFDWGYREELVICSIPYASFNWRNSRQLYCSPMHSETGSEKAFLNPREEFVDGFQDIWY